MTLHNGIDCIPEAGPKCTRCGADMWLEYWTYEHRLRKPQIQMLVL